MFDWVLITPLKRLKFSRQTKVDQIIATVTTRSHGLLYLQYIYSIVGHGAAFLVTVFVLYSRNNCDTFSIRCNVCHFTFHYYLLAKLLTKAQNTISISQQKKHL